MGPDGAKPLREQMFGSVTRPSVEPSLAIAMPDSTPTPTDPYPLPAVADEPTVAWWSSPGLIARGAIAVAVAIGALTLVGWLVGVPELRALGPGIGPR
jgi:hypothetical protein